MIGRAVAGLILGLLILAVVAAAVIRPDRALRSATGMTAHNLCDAVFTQHLAAEPVFRELVQPMAGPVKRLLRYRIDRADPAVDANLMGLFGARAQWTEGYGCRMVLDRRYAASPPLPPPAPSSSDEFAPASVVAPQGRLKSAFDAEFTDPPGATPRYVKAVVIVVDGKIVAERYAPGYSVDTPLLSYSVSKSFTNAFLGILVRQGRLAVDRKVGAPEWAKPGDPRAQLTLDDLERMQSGLNAPETGSGFDPVSHMLFLHDDMAHFAASHPLEEPPRRHWNYTSANTLILDRVLGQTVGGGAVGFRRFADQELFQPLHMDGVTLEFDGVGTFSGSAHVYAPARAFARFGQLYLDDGVTPQGRRILPEGWSAYSRRSALGAPYGAGFWTLDGNSELARSLISQGFPADGYFASGNRGQRIYIVPSKRLVMVRFGYTGGEAMGIHEDMTLLRAAIAALH